MINRLILIALSCLAINLPALAGTVADQVRVEAPYVRAMPPGLPNSAAFMGLRNTDANAHKLVAAESPASEVVELHTHIDDNGVMRMRQVESVSLPALDTRVLQPGGLHLMLIGLREQLVPGNRIDLTLIFEDGSKARVRAQVKKIMSPAMKQGGGRCGSGRCGGGKCGGK